MPGPNQLRFPRIAALAGALGLGLVFAGASGACAQTLSLDLGPGGGVTERALQLVALVTVLALAPSILVMVTSFTRIVVVLSLLRSAIGTQTAPPNGVIVGLALFLTAFVMAPTFRETYRLGVRSEEHTSELQSRQYLVCRLLLEKKKKQICKSVMD